MAETAARIEAAIDDLLPALSGPEAPLWQAMRYGSLGGGKRLRPFLAMESARLFDVVPERALRVGAAVELIHCYSLIHDDLPAMDDSDLRRGRPTVHKQFDDAIAVLAGDGLQSLAFEVLAHPETDPDPAVRCALVSALAAAAGPRGMVGGQMMDLIAETTPFDLDAVIRLQGAKTGQLIAFPCIAGAILGRASDTEQQALHDYAEALGLAFQIADDLLDVEGSEAVVGKSVGRDAEAGKATFVSLLGIEPARDRARRLVAEAAASLECFGDKAENLKAVAWFVVERRA